MTDVELTRALEEGRVRNEDFRHVSHLHVAWVYLAESQSAEQAAEKMSSTLRRFAASAGHAEKYHETITQFWIRLLGALRNAQQQRDLDSILQAFPRLLEKDFPLDYYSREKLFSDRARTSWVEPDLKPFSTDAIAIHSSSSTGNTPDRVVCR